MAGAIRPKRRENSNFNPELNAKNTEPLENVWLPTDNPLTKETQLKSSSLPPGLALTSELPSKLARSRSSASKNSEITSPQYKRNLSTPELERDSTNYVEALPRLREMFGAVGEEDEEEDRIEEKKKEESFFGRLLSRRSGKKKKEKIEEEEIKTKLPEIPVVPKRIDEKGRYANERTYESHGSRSKVGVRARQRIEPINLPPSPEPTRNDVNRDFDSFLEPNFPPTSPVKPDSSTNRMQISYSASPPKPTWPEGSIYAKPSPTETKIVDYVPKPREEEPQVKPKLRIGGLTSYQQKVTSINDNYDERDYSSLIHTPSIDANLKQNSMLKKSKSFRDNVETSANEKDFPSLNSGFGDYFQYRNNETRNTASFNSIVTPDSLEVNNSSFNIKKSSKEEEVAPPSPEKTQDTYRGMFTKNVFITSRSVFKETKTRQESVLKKSSSLESISSVEASPSPVRMATRSSSSESISSLTRHTTTSPINSAGVSITQTVSSVQEDRSKKIEDNIQTSQTSSGDSKLTSGVLPLSCFNNHTKPLDINKGTSVNTPDGAEVSNVVQMEETVPRGQPPKREVRGTRETSLVPEFLRVQLNRVDSKPALNIVLSTSAIFDADKVESPKPDEHSKPRTNLLNGSVEHQKDTVENVVPTVQKDKHEEPQVSLLGLRIKKSSCEEQVVVDKVRLEKPIEIIETNSIRSPDKVTKHFEEKIDPLPVPKPRSISLHAPLSPVNKFCGVPITGTPIKPLFKKPSTVNLEEANQKENKRQMSNDNIKIVEKEIPADVVFTRKSVSSENDVTEKQLGDSDNFGYPDVVLRKKNSVKEFSPKTEDDRRTSGEESPDITLRKKSRDFGQRREEEPELLKVFARRSLKIKDSDSEAIGQQLAKKEAQDSEPAAKSRDSDKENEGDSPKEERKKPPTKEPLVESKHRIEEPSKGAPVNTNAPRLPFKYQRSISVIGSMPIQVIESNGLSSKENNISPEKRHRKSVPDGPNVTEKLSNRWANIHKDIEIDVTNTIEVKKPMAAEVKKSTATDTKPSTDCEEDTPRFKRIQQRKEEWELRAQQAAKKNLP